MPTHVCTNSHPCVCVCLCACVRVCVCVEGNSPREVEILITVKRLAALTKDACVIVDGTDRYFLKVSFFVRLVF